MTPPCDDSRAPRARRSDGGNPREGAGDCPSSAEQGLSLVGRLGLAGRTGFYLVLTGITARIAALGGRSGRQADAHGALALVARPAIGKVAIGAVALGFVFFGVGRLIGAVQDATVSSARRTMTVLQGLFYVALAYVPAAFLAGNQQTGSQQQQQKSTAELLGLPAGRELIVAVGVVLILVCAQQIHGAITHDFREGLDLDEAPGVVRRLVDTAGLVGIAARALVFVPVGVFLIVAAVQFNPGHSYGTDAELLRLAGYSWGRAVLVVVAAGLAIFVVYSSLETRYRKVVSAK